MMAYSAACSDLGSTILSRNCRPPCPQVCRARLRCQRVGQAKNCRCWRQRSHTAASLGSIWQRAWWRLHRSLLQPKAWPTVWRSGLGMQAVWMTWRRCALWSQCSGCSRCRRLPRSWPIGHVRSVQSVEEAGPWQRLAQLTAPARPAADWETGIPGAAVAQGADLVRDERVQHSMEWASVGAFWEGMTRAGPWHSRVLAYGEQHMEDVRRKFLEAYPAAEAGRAEEPLRHTPAARLVCLRRRPQTPAAAL